MKNRTFSDRRQEAEAAKVRLLEKLKARPAEDGPEAREREAARQARSAAQAERKAAVELEKRNKAQIMKAEAEAAAEAKRIAEDQQLKRAAEAEEAQTILDEAARKEKRDQRYANRKAKK